MLEISVNFYAPRSSQSREIRTPERGTHCNTGHVTRPDCKHETMAALSATMAQRFSDCVVRVLTGWLGGLRTLTHQAPPHQGARSHKSDSGIGFWDL